MHINEQYVLKKKVSQGSFGVVYVGQDVLTKQYVAIKVEKQDKSSLEREAMFLQHLAGVPTVPRLHYVGKNAGQTSMVIQFLGRDLTYYLKQYKKFSVKCVLLIADSLINTLESIHIRSVLHRDIKPENILTGRENDSQLYLVDFGISKFYRDRNGIHIPPSSQKSFLGTSRYASIAAHLGHELSRRDDLESLGYVLIYLLKGSLPWQHIKYTEDEKIRVVGEYKQKLPLQELCKGLPIEFLRLIDYARKLDFKATPDYKFLRSMFAKACQQYPESRFDWEQSVPSLLIPHNHSENTSLLKQRSRRATDQIQDKRNSHSTLNDPLSGNSFLRMPEQNSSGHKLTLSPNHERISQRKFSNGSFNETYSQRSGFISVLGNPSHQTNLSHLSFEMPQFVINNNFESLSMITKRQLNDNLDDDEDNSPSPLILKYRKLSTTTMKAHFKKTLIRSEYKSLGQ